MITERVTALCIPCPWSGDDNDSTDWRYAAWYQLYSRSRVVRHWLGLHDWHPTPDPYRRYCTWCGTRRGTA
jgi:hypothetical protein